MPTKKNTDDAGTQHKPETAGARRAAGGRRPPQQTLTHRAREGGDLGAKFPRYRMVKTDELIPYDNNPRTHSDAQISKLVRSIREFGFTNPILTDGDAGVIAGHGRLLAAKGLGLETVPTIELKHLTPAQRKAYVIADNKLALEADFDPDLLRIELSSLKEMDFDTDFTGFDPMEVDKLFASDPDAHDETDGGATGTLEGKVACPSCGHEFQTISKSFRLIAAKKPRSA